MKNFILRTYLLLFFLFSSFVTLAQIPEDTPTDPEQTPINGQLLWLAVAGIAFAVFYFSKKRLKNA